MPPLPEISWVVPTILTGATEKKGCDIMKMKNYVEAQGKIVKIEKRDGEYGFGTILLLVKAGAKESTITFSLTCPIDPSISRRDTVKVMGHIGATPTYIDENGKRRSDQFFIADSVEPSKTTLEMLCGVKGNIYYPEHYFRCCIVGKLIHFHKSTDEWGRIYIATVSDTDWTTRIMLNYYLKGLMPDPEAFRKGDEVALVAGINVNSKEYVLEDGRTVTRKFENLYVEDIVVLNQADVERMPA